jgi:hypothetical protein
MPLTQITGPGGSVTFLSGFNGKFNNWTATVTNPTVETTGFADNGSKTNKPGGPISMAGTITAVGNFDAAATAPIPSAGIGTNPTFSSWEGSITLQAATGCTFAASVVANSVVMTRGNAGRFELSFSWESSGPITETWDET